MKPRPTPADRELAHLERVARQHGLVLEVDCSAGYLRSSLRPSDGKGGVFHGATALSSRGADKALVLGLDLVRRHITEAIAERAGHRVAAQIGVPS